MQKEIYILRGLASEDYNSFKKRILNISHTVLKKNSPESLKTVLTVKPPPALSVIPFKKKKVAVFSLIRSQESPPEIITGDPGYEGGYTVEEAIPVAYKKDWEDGIPSPGVCLLTLFHKKPGIDRETFIRRWHEGHTPLSLRLHPLWNYNRNVVTGSISPDGTWFDGIVEEHFRKASDLLNPLIFFGPALKAPRHMYEVLVDSRSFIHMKRIETYLCEEIHFKSPEHT